MCTKRLVSSFLKAKDIEQGSTEENENLRPLLGFNRLSAQLPQPRPNNLSLLQSWNSRHPYPHLSNLTIPDYTPSEPSTVNNTPLTEAGEHLRRWTRGDRRLRRLNTELLEAITAHDVEEVEILLNAGANPNATCWLGLVSACHLAALFGGDTLGLLLKYGAERLRLDRLGRTPLHLAAWAGNTRQMAIILDFPEDLHDRIENEISEEDEENVKNLHEKTKTLVNVRSDINEVNTILPNHWKDNIDHNCKDIKGSLPLLQSGWTPLHVASACAHRQCIRLLLAAGADPNISDDKGFTALDVAGSAINYDQQINPEHFTEVIQMLLKAECQYNTMKKKGIDNVNTPLHTAVDLECIEAINELLNAGASVSCLNAAGKTPLHVCVDKQFEECLQVLANYGATDSDPMCPLIDVKDADGHTVLQAAIEAAWVAGVCVALEAGADVTLKANDGETPIHSAAALGNLDVFNEIISVAKQKDSIDYQNEEGETALFKAVIHGHIDCVQAILNEGASIKITLPGDVNILHVAAEYGHSNILKLLIEHDEVISREMINALSAGDRRGFGPLHFAVSGDHIECVQVLLSKNADIRLRTTCSPHKSSTPLHIAAVKNNTEIAKVILAYDKTTIHEVNSMGWFPLHTAGHHGSRDVITLLLKEGADLSGYTDGPKKFRRTAIEMIINNLSKSADFFEEVFDSYISTNILNLQDPNCEIVVDYRVLMPNECDLEQIKVIEALIKTGNRHGQKRLLVHPLVESFLYLKWKALLPFFYAIIVLYGFFVGSLTIFTVSVFFYTDTQTETPVWLNVTAWGYVVYASICLILCQELLYMNVKSSRYFLQFETWIKFGSLSLAAILPTAISVVSVTESEWPRHVATLALLLSWIQLMFLLSRFPNWGYYVLMFGKVASNVVKILATFMFLVIGFSLSFMIQFHSAMPFESPWAALVKTVVMMTSEFDYEALFDEEHSRNLETSLVIVRLIFLVFLILAAIVLMNLMVGVAVNDINDLEILGNIRRLAKQVEFLSTLDTLVYNKVFVKMLPNRISQTIKSKRNVRSMLVMNPGKPRWKHNKVMTSRIRDAIFQTAMKQKQEMDHKIGLEDFKSKIDDMHSEILISREKRLGIEMEKAQNAPKSKLRHEEVIKHLNEIDEDVSEIKDQLKSYAAASKTPIEEINVKIDQMSLELEEVKQFLSRLESKIGSLVAK